MVREQILTDNHYLQYILFTQKMCLPWTVAMGLSSLNVLKQELSFIKCFEIKINNNESAVILCLSQCWS